MLIIWAAQTIKGSHLTWLQCPFTDRSLLEVCLSLLRTVHGKRYEILHLSSKTTSGVIFLSLTRMFSSVPLRSMVANTHPQVWERGRHRRLLLQAGWWVCRVDRPSLLPPSWPHFQWFPCCGPSQSDSSWQEAYWIIKERRAISVIYFMTLGTNIAIWCYYIL